MPFSEEQSQKIVARLNEKIPNARCPMCANEDFSLVPYFAVTTLQDNTKAVVLGGPSLLSIPIICKRCGATQYLNIYALGLAEELGVTIADQPAKTEEKQ